MREWILIALGLGCLTGIGFLAHGCGGGSRGDERVTLSAADRSAVEAAAKAIAGAAGKGDTTVLDAAVTPGLPQREVHALRAALASLRGKPPLTVTKTESLGAGGAVVTLEGDGATRTWRFNRGADGTWTLSGA